MSASLEVLFIRHGRTDWNDAGRIQGHTDIPLNETGRRECAERGVPPRYAGATWFASPLSRALETARLIGAPASLATDDRLREMCWGEWEGRVRADIRAENPAAYDRDEGRGLDYRPPGAESPREVQVRLLDWMRETATTTGSAIAVTHRGVIRAALAMATGWDLTGSSPHHLDWGAGQGFRYLPESDRIRIEALNVSLMDGRRT